MERAIVRAIAEMPVTMRELAWVQICTWMGLFCMWLYFPVAVARNVFGAPDTASPLYARGVEWAGVCFAMYSAVCFVFSFFLPSFAARLGRRATHSVCLICGALGLLSVAVIRDEYLLLLSMTGVGIAWAGTLSMPYAMLAGALPANKTGIYMGIFNFFIVLPEIAASLGFGWVMSNVLGNDRMAAVIAGGFFFCCSPPYLCGVFSSELEISTNGAKLQFYCPRVLHSATSHARWRRKVPLSATDRRSVRRAVARSIHSCRQIQRQPGSRRS